jgi:3-oxoacyl-[acyl-carrier protein] reductase
MKDRVAFITGGAQGIGLACVRLFAESGAKVVLADVNADKLNQSAVELAATGAEAMCAVMDVSNPADVEKAMEAARERFGKIEILVNNAGITRDQLLVRMKKEDWDRVIAVNLTGVFLCTQAVLPGMMRQRYGRIVNVASVVGRMGNVGQANYIASKAGVIGLTKATAQEVASRNITVNAVAPGFIATAMTENLPEAARERLLQRVPLARMGTDRDVAAAVRFLASEEAGYITGHVLDVNGGMYMA